MGGPIGNRLQEEIIKILFPGPSRTENVLGQTLSRVLGGPQERPQGGVAPPRVGTSGFAGTPFNSGGGDVASQLLRRSLPEMPGAGVGAGAGGAPWERPAAETPGYAPGEETGPGTFNVEDKRMGKVQRVPIEYMTPKGKKIETTWVPQNTYNATVARMAKAGLKVLSPKRQRDMPQGQDLQREIETDTAAGNYTQRPDTVVNTIMNMIHSPDPSVKDYARRMYAPVVRQAVGRRSLPGGGDMVDVSRRDPRTGGVIQTKMPRAEAQRVTRIATTARKTDWERLQTLVTDGLDPSKPKRVVSEKEKKAAQAEIDKNIGILTDADWVMGAHEKTTGGGQKLERIDYMNEAVDDPTVESEWVSRGPVVNARRKALKKDGMTVLPLRATKTLDYWKGGIKVEETLPKGKPFTDREREINELVKSDPGNYSLESPKDTKGRTIKKDLWRPSRDANGKTTYKKESFTGTVEDYNKRLEGGALAEKAKLMPVYDRSTGAAVDKMQVPGHLAGRVEAQLNKQGRTLNKPRTEVRVAKRLFEAPNGEIKRLSSYEEVPAGYREITGTQLRDREEKLISAEAIIAAEPGDADAIAQAMYYNKHTQKPYAYLYTEWDRTWPKGNKKRVNKITLPTFRGEKLTSGKLSRIAQTNNMKEAEALYWVMVENKLPPSERKKPSIKALKKAKGDVKIWSAKQGLTQNGLLVESPQEEYRKLMSDLQAGGPEETIEERAKRAHQKVSNLGEEHKKLRVGDSGGIPGWIKEGVMASQKVTETEADKLLQSNLTNMKVEWKKHNPGQQMTPEIEGAIMQRFVRGLKDKGIIQ